MADRIVLFDQILGHQSCSWHFLAQGETAKRFSMALRLIGVFTLTTFVHPFCRVELSRWLFW